MKTANISSGIIYAILAILGLTPIMLYIIAVKSAPAVSPEEAFRSLQCGASELVDVKKESLYFAEHITGSSSWSYAYIKKIESQSQIPENMRNITLFMISQDGYESAHAVKKLRSIGFMNCYSVDGGIDIWTGAIENSASARYTTYTVDEGKIIPFPSKNMTAFGQNIQAFTAVFLKPFYMILSGILIWYLGRKKSHDMVLLKRAMQFFLAGEILCAVNYMAFNDRSVITEYLHGYGMVVCFSLIFLALLRGMEKRLIHHMEPDKKCIMLPLCGVCWKYSQVQCRFVLIFSFIMVSMIILSLMPLQVKPVSVSFTAMVLKDKVHYIQPLMIQLFESGISPLIATVLFASSLVLANIKRYRFFYQAEVLACFGMGYISFGFFRLILFALFREELWWFGMWEEFTEFLFIIGIVLVLWLFRKGLSETPAKTETEQT